VKKNQKKKESTLEELKQKYILAKEKSAEKKMLLGLIRLKEPGFKG